MPSSPCFWVLISAVELVSLFRIVKYSSLIYFLGRHRNKLFRSFAVLLFALITSLLYEDVRHYLELQHPGTLLYALIAKMVIVYSSFAFVLWQFRPGGGPRPPASAAKAKPAPAPMPRIDAFADVDRHTRLRSRYDRVLKGDSAAEPGAQSTSRDT